jgi:hypothetical protein
MTLDKFYGKKDIGADSTEAFADIRMTSIMALFLSCPTLEFQDTKQKLQRETVITG